MYFKILVQNELKKLLGHNPSFDETKSALEYLTDNWESEITTFADIPGYLEDWRSNNCFKCDSCGKYFLETDIYHEEDHLVGKTKLCKTCYWNGDVALDYKRGC